MTFTDILGYVATGFVAVSFLLPNVRQLRALNTCGAFLFIIYGALTHTYPVCVVNSFIAGVNLVYLYKDLKGAMRPAKKSS